MTLIINGETNTVTDGITLVQLLDQLNLSGKPVAVELNLEALPASVIEQTSLSDQDRLEIVVLAPGG